MSYEKAKKHLEKYGFADKIVSFDISTETVALAAKALGCEEKEIAKSITFYDNSDNGCIMIVAAGDAKIDNKKFKDKFGFKSKMLQFEDVERLTGHAVGGVCPFGVGENVKVYLDASLNRFSFVFPAAGCHNNCVKMTVDELKVCSECLDVVDVCKAWQDSENI